MEWQFSSVLYLFFLVIIWGGGMALWWWRRKKWLSRFNPDFYELLFPDLAKSVNYLKFFIVIFAYVLIVVGLANPRIGIKKEKVKVKGVQAMICLDMSESMNATDIKPSRLALAKNIIKQLTRILNGHSLGFVTFAGNAYLQTPPTIDLSVLNMVVDIIETKDMPLQGTSISAGLLKALQSFNDSANTTKVIILITDAEDHEGNLEEVISALKEKGINVILVGVGTPEGATIPVVNNGRVVDFKRDKDGNVVITRLNYEVLNMIAKTLQAPLIIASSPLETALAINNEIEKLKKGELQEYVFTSFFSYYHYFAAGAFLLLLVEMLIPYRKIRVPFLVPEKGGELP